MSDKSQKDEKDSVDDEPKGIDFGVGWRLLHGMDQEEETQPASQGVKPDEREALDRLFQAYVRGGRAAMDEEYRKINPPRSMQPAGDEAETPEASEE